MRPRKVRVLFLCIGNSCRSQMAEGWANHLGSEWLEAASAGIEAHGMNPRTIFVMREAGVDISHHESTSLKPQSLAWTDLVVTVCGHADEHWPVLPPAARKKHWPLEDPAKVSGANEKVMAMFRATRDEVKNRVASLVGELKTRKCND